MSYTSVFGGTTIYPSDVSYLPLALAVDTTLEWPLEASGDVTVAARIIGVTPASAGLSVIMPDATRTGPGQSVLFNNMSGTYSFLVKDDGGSTLATVTPGTQWQIYLTDNTSAAGTWEVYQMGASTATVQASALAGPGLMVVGSQLAQAAPFTNFTGNLSPSISNRAAMYVYTGTGAATLSLPIASAVGSKYFLRVRNQGGGVLVVDPAGTDLINGSTFLNLAPEDSAMIVCDGASEWYTVGLGQNAEFTFDFTSIPVTGGTYTLSGNQLNRIAYRFTGTLTSNAVIVVPATVQQYWVDNQTDGPFTLGLRTPTQVSPTLVNQHASAIMYSDGTEVVLADTSTLSLPVSVAQGGTGATTPTGARANLGISPYADPLVTAANSPAAQAVLFPAPITDGQILIGNAATPGFAQTTLTAGTGINVLNGPGTVTIVNTGSPAPGSVYSQRFSGTGSQTAFTLAYQPYTEENTQVYINGVYQQKDTYSLSGFVITFSVAPPLGTDNIEVVVIQVVPIGATTASMVALGPVGYTTATTVQQGFNDLGSSNGAGKLGLAQGGTVQDGIRYFTPQMFGAAGDGVTNDSAAFQAAVDAASAAGGGLVIVPEGSYVANAVAPKSNVTIQAHGATITSPASRVISWPYDVNDVGVVGSGKNLDTGINYKVGDTAITLAVAGDGATFAAGDFVTIRCRGLVSLSPNITPVAELNKVRSVSGGVITLEHPLSKDFTYDATYPYTITKLDPTKIIQNFHVVGGTWSAPTNRPIDIQTCWDVSIRDTTLTGVGGTILRGRFMRIISNRINLNPTPTSWAVPLRPYYFGSDTGSSEGIFVNNQCTSTGTGIVHLHEGLGNFLVHGNTFEQGVVDTGTAELWPVISILALSWDIKIIDNTIVNSPRRNGIFSNPSSIYPNEGNVRLQIVGNEVLGTCSTYGIQHSQGSLDTGVVIARNTIAAVCNAASTPNTYQFGITSAPGVTVTGNVSSTGINLIDQATITADATRIVDNTGIPDNTRVFVNTQWFNATSGTPTRVTWRGGRGTIWALDPAVQEIIDAMTMVPYGATQVYVYLWWSNLGAGSGDVRWGVAVSSGLVDGENADQSDTTLSFTATAGAQNVVVRSYAGGVTLLDDFGAMPIRVIRSGADAADTLPNDAGVIGVELIFR